MEADPAGAGRWQAAAIPARGELSSLVRCPASRLAAGDARRPTPSASGRFGREGEVVRELVPEFERRHPDIRSRSSRSPGRPPTRSCSPPSWATPCPTRRSSATPGSPSSSPLAPWRLSTSGSPARRARRKDSFSGIWDTNVAQRRDLGAALVRRHAAALLPHRPRGRGGRAVAAAELGRVAGGHGAHPRAGRAAASPSCCLSMSGRSRSSSASQSGAPLLADGGRRGAFRDPRFRRPWPSISASTPPGWLRRSTCRRRRTSTSSSRKGTSPW